MLVQYIDGKPLGIYDHNPVHFKENWPFCMRGDFCVLPRASSTGNRPVGEL